MNQAAMTASKNDTEITCDDINIKNISGTITTTTTSTGTTTIGAFSPEESTLCFGDGMTTPYFETTTTSQVPSQESSLRQQPSQHIRPKKSKRIIPVFATTTTATTTAVTTSSLVTLSKSESHSMTNLKTNPVAPSILRKSSKYTKPTTPTATNITTTAPNGMVTFDSIATKPTEPAAVMGDVQQHNDRVVERPRDRQRRRRSSNQIEGCNTVPSRDSRMSSDQSKVGMNNDEQDTNDNADTNTDIDHDINKLQHHLAVTTTTATTMTATMTSLDCINIDKADNDDDSTKPLIFNSLADLMEMAGTLPSIDDDDGNRTANRTSSGIRTSDTHPTTMMETQLDFSVIDPMDYQQQQNDIFYGMTSVPSPRGTTIDDDDDNNDVDHHCVVSSSINSRRIGGDGDGDDLNDRSKSSHTISPPMEDHTNQQKGLNQQIPTTPALDAVSTIEKDASERPDCHR